MKLIDTKAAVQCGETHIDKYLEFAIGMTFLGRSFTDNIFDRGHNVFCAQNGDVKIYDFGQAKEHSGSYGKYPGKGTCENSQTSVGCEEHGRQACLDGWKKNKQRCVWKYSTLTMELTHMFHGKSVEKTKLITKTFGKMKSPSLVLKELSKDSSSAEEYIANAEKYIANVEKAVKNRLQNDVDNEGRKCVSKEMRLGQENQTCVTNPIPIKTILTLSSKTPIWKRLPSSFKPARDIISWEDEDEDPTIYGCPASHCVAVHENDALYTTQSIGGPPPAACVTPSGG
jgi:hypothetical protein